MNFISRSIKIVFPPWKRNIKEGMNSYIPLCLSFSLQLLWQNVLSNFSFIFFSISFSFLLFSGAPLLVYTYVTLVPMRLPQADWLADWLVVLTCALYNILDNRSRRSGISRSSFSSRDYRFLNRSYIYHIS